MTEVQAKLAEERFEATAGGGVVKAVVDGKQMLRELKIDPDTFKEGDVTLIEDLVMAAVSEAQSASEKQMQATLGKLTGGFPMPF
jgi:hypothetical protein